MDKEQFLARRSAPNQVTLNDGTTVQVRKLSQYEVSKIQKQYSKADNAIEGLAYIVCRCVLNDNGDRFFADSDLERLQATDFDTIKTISDAVLKYSGLSDGKNA